MTLTVSLAPAQAGRRRLLLATLASAALAACGPADDPFNNAVDLARQRKRQDLLDRTASAAVAAGLVSTSLRYADSQSNAAAVAGVREKGLPVATAVGDWLRIGSASKAMTACMAAALIERGSLTWTLSLADALPELAADMRPEFRSVTVEQLLAHRGGLIALNNDADVGLFLEYLAAQTEPLPETFEGRRRMAAAWALAQPQPGVTPGLDFQYSNVDYLLVGMILEARSGKPFADLFSELIAQTVGPGLSLGPPTSAGSTVQRGHVGPAEAVEVFAGYPPELQVWQDVLVQASGNVFATLPGYALWQRQHQQALRGETTRLPPGYVQRLRAGAEGYALGWERGALPEAFKEQVCLFHSGIVEGFSIYSVIAQGGQFAIAACTNTEGQGADPDWALRLLAQAIFDMQSGWD